MSPTTSDSPLSWYFEPVPPMGGASAGAYRNSLAGAGVPRAELFAREAIQNSVDAVREPSEEVRVRFRTRTLEGSELDSFRRDLNLTPTSAPLTRSGLLPSAESSDLEELLGPKLRVLHVEDYNTVGLGGTIESIADTDEDNYFRLCLQLGDTREAEGRGGTFGYGKSVYWAFSSLWTVVMYSRFEPTRRTGGAHARLIGISWFESHIHGDGTQRFTGRAWCGDVSGSRCSPLVDDEAHAMAQRLGLDVRDVGKEGLSILIVGPETDLGDIREGVEEHWWPRLLDNRLSVEFVDETRPMPKPDPKSKPGLARFVRAWETIRERQPPGDVDLFKNLTYKRSPLGRFAITMGDDAEPGSESSTNEDAHHVRIATVRGPGMVVQYLEGPPIAPGQPACDAAFLADPSRDRVLAACEPPAHNRWDYDTTRRDRLISSDDRTVIRKIFENLRKESRGFLRSKQEPPPEPPPRCRELEKILGRYVGIEKDSRPPPPRGHDPFQIRFKTPVRRQARTEGVVLDAEVDFTLRESPDERDEELVRVTAWVDTVVDRGAAAPKADRVPIPYLSVKDPFDGREILGAENAGTTTVEFVAKPGETVYRVGILSAALPMPEYRAELRFQAEIIPT